MNNNKIRILWLSIFLITLVNVSGAIAMKHYGAFINLVVYNFILHVFLIVLNQEDRKKQLLICIVIISLLTFIVEFIGISTGIAFGNYYYTDKLEPKFIGVPLFIGLLYFTLIYALTNIVDSMFHFWGKRYIVWKYFHNIIVTGFWVAFLVTLIDYVFIEHVAVQLNWWIWLENNQMPPATNFITWFCVCFVCAIIFKSNKFVCNTYLSWAIVSAMLMFFIIVLYL